MTLEKNSKKFLFIGTLFCLFAILFALLYYFKVISYLDLYLAVTYISYFVGLALLYNGAYNREREHRKASLTSYAVGVIVVCLSIAMLVYGLISGLIVLF